MFAYTRTNVCRLCKSENVQDILDLGEQFVVNFIPPHQIQDWKDGKVEKAIPLILMVCKDCSYVQIRHSVDPDRLYRKFWYKSGINESMRNTLREIVYEAKDIAGISDEGNVMDIASNDGTLLSFYPDSMLKVGFDPALNLRNEAMSLGRTPHIIADYFTEEAYQKWTKGMTGPSFDVITAISMFYDLEDPVPFLQLIKKIMKDTGVFVIQMNYLLTMLRDRAIDNIAHEHLGYYSLTALSRLMDRCGLQIQDASLNGVNGGSIRVFIAHKGRQRTITQITNVATIAKGEIEAKLADPETYVAFGEAMTAIKNQITHEIGRYISQDKTVYLYGASTRGSTLMQYLDLPEGWIKGAAERNPEKYGHFMVGTWIPIVSEEFARKDADLFVVLPWHFKSAILAREEGTMMDGVNMLFPLPTPLVYQVKRIV